MKTFKLLSFLSVFLDLALGYLLFFGINYLINQVRFLQWSELSAQYTAGKLEDFGELTRTPFWQTLAYWIGLFFAPALMDSLGIGRRLVGLSLHYEKATGWARRFFKLVQRNIFFVALLFLFGYAPSQLFRKLYDMAILEPGEKSIQALDIFSLYTLIFLLAMLLVVEGVSILQTGRRFLDPWAGVTPTPRKPTPAPTLNPEPAA